jgi:hypothetical protein
MESKNSIIEVEKSCLRLVARAIRDFWPDAKKIFAEETDLPQDVAEDVTQEALTKLGISQISTRLYGKIDYKRAAFLFLPDREVEVALLVDSKAEKDGDTATLQMSQTSMEIRQLREGKHLCVKGALPDFIIRNERRLQTVTIIVKYEYNKLPDDKGMELVNIKIACIPNIILQDDFNPNEDDTIWQAGRNAPSLGEEFRVRLSFKKLKTKAAWRVVEINSENQ